jgi:hypothetical protein
VRAGHDFGPGATITSASDVNDRGQIVGAYVDADGAVHGFLLDQDVFTTIDQPGAAGGNPALRHQQPRPDRRLSSDGVRLRGFLLSNGTFTRITPPGAFIPFLIGTLATDIDDRGRIAGASL